MRCLLRVVPRSSRSRVHVYMKLPLGDDESRPERRREEAKVKDVFFLLPLLFSFLRARFHCEGTGTFKRVLLSNTFPSRRDQNRKHAQEHLPMNQARCACAIVRDRDRDCRRERELSVSM